MIVVGLMSGTSADGVDAAVVELRGAPPALSWQVLAHQTVPHPPALRAEILACCDPQTGTVARLCTLNVWLGEAFAAAALAALRAAGVAPHEVAVIGSHGQTVWHAPSGPFPSTLQLGSPAVIAERTGCAVVSDFRARDLAAGGQGAPLVALVDTLLFTDPRRARAVQNIGGIGNVTFVPAAGAGRALAFDTGPGNVLIDDAVARWTAGAQQYDRDGQIALSGQADEAWLAELLQHPYFELPPPKTTGREVWGAQLGAEMWATGQGRGLRGPDIVATMTALTAASIAQSYRRWLPEPPAEVIVSGGGALNPALMTMLGQAIAPAGLLTSDQLGLAATAKEAVAFALLAYESWHGRPGNLPAATGAARPAVLGSTTPAPRPQPAPGDSAALPLTEQRNPRTLDLDQLPTRELIERLNHEDATVAEAVARETPRIAAVVDALAERMARGGRLIYVGAGTSGRLGVLDASECPPTFGTSPLLVQAIIAGGAEAITGAIEGAEDDGAGGAAAVAALALNATDTVVGIAASGSTPFVAGALTAARAAGALTVALVCNHPSRLAALADLAITPLVGPEALAGSTRLKAGTAQKMVLNLLSTGALIRLGKTFSNLMVDVQPTNIKLRQRAERIVATACDVSADIAADALAGADGEVKTAIVALLAGVDAAEARRRTPA